MAASRVTEREVSVCNLHPCLRVDGRGVARVLRRLDAEFVPLPGDVRWMTSEGQRRAEPRLVAVAGAGSLVPEGELSVVFMTDAELARLHGEHLGDPSATDVITFEGEPGMGLAGEVCVSADAALAYSKKNHTDFAQELLRYVVHGWLHLAGYDDLEPGKKRRMRAAEGRALRLLARAGVVPAFRMRE